VKEGDETVHGPNRTHRATCLLLATAVLLIVALEMSQALPRVRRYIELTATPTALDLGQVPKPGTYDSPAVLSLHLAANCNHGNVVISATQFESAEGGVIPPSRILVKLPDTGQFVPMNYPIPVAPPAGPGVCDFQLSFRVATLQTDPAGTYTGTFQLTTLGVESFPGVPGPAVPCTLELELFTSYALLGGKCYVHIGNVFEATEEDLTVHPTGTLTTNAGMYIGLNLSAMSNITQASFETSGGGLTGRIFRAMVGTVDVLGRDISNEAIDLRILLSWNAGGSYAPPDYYGYSPDGNISKTLWWLVNGGNPNNYDLDWEIRLLPEPAQADGNYYLECEVVVAPLL
jgi:hypothetical protein